MSHVSHTKMCVIRALYVRYTCAIRALCVRLDMATPKRIVRRGHPVPLARAYLGGLLWQDADKLSPFQTRSGSGQACLPSTTEPGRTDREYARMGCPADSMAHAGQHLNAACHLGTCLSTGCFWRTPAIFTALAGNRAFGPLSPAVPPPRCQNPKFRASVRPKSRRCRVFRR